jgi:phosphoenolpyruvate carboxykinase (ATP)
MNTIRFATDRRRGWRPLLAYYFSIVIERPGVPAEILRPRESWADQAAHDTAAKKLAALSDQNLETYAGDASAEVNAAAPVV